MNQAQWAIANLSDLNEALLVCRGDSATAKKGAARAEGGKNKSCIVRDCIV